MKLHKNPATHPAHSEPPSQRHTSPSLPDARASTQQQRSLKETVQHSPAVQRQAARHAAIQSGVVQRVVKVNNKDIVLENLLENLQNDVEKDVLRNWHASENLHNFKSGQDLTHALEAAAENEREPTDLYKKDNLKFLTQAPNRLPTLYFSSDLGSSGRIRQQHSAGPAVKSQMNKKDYFFPDKDKAEAFRIAANKAAASKQDFEPNLGDFEATETPEANYAHVEVTYKPGTSRVAKVHKSEGLISLPTDDHTDDYIKLAYKQSVGSRK